MNVRNKRPLFVLTEMVVLVVMMMAPASKATGQARTRETVIQKATEQFEDSPLTITSLSPGLYVFSGDGGNVTAIVDDGSTLIIDSGIASRISELSDAIFRTTMRPVTRLVNTHWHFDHTGGNTYFGSSGVTIIAQENVKNELSSAEDVPFVGLRDGHYPPQALPGLTYQSSLTLHQGSRLLTLQNYGAAHTDGDTVIYIAPANVAAVGDIFSNHFYPIIDLSSRGSIDGMIHAIDQILGRTDEQTKIVPGHGPVTTVANLKDYRDMLVQVRQCVKDLITAGKTMDEVVAAMPTKDFDARWASGYVTPEVFTRMVFASLAGANGDR
jgi:cyclase